MFLAPPHNTTFIRSIVDSCSRLSWDEVQTSKKSMPLMFQTLKMINTLHVTYGVQIAEILSDNGSYFASHKIPEEQHIEAMRTCLCTAQCSSIRNRTNERPDRYRLPSSLFPSPTAVQRSEVFGLLFARFAHRSCLSALAKYYAAACFFGGKRP